MAVLSPRGPMADSGDSFCCHSMTSRGANSISWVEAGDTAHHPTIHRTAPRPRIFRPEGQYC